MLLFMYIFLKYTVTAFYISFERNQYKSLAWFSKGFSYKWGVINLSVKYIEKIDFFKYLLINSSSLHYILLFIFYVQGLIYIITTENFS